MFSMLYQIARWEVLIFVGGVGGLILTGLLTGRVNTHFLLWGRRADGTRYFSTERVQLLVATIAIAIDYLFTAVHTPSGNMPKIPGGALELLGASNAIYLGGKGWMMLRNKKL
jgi:hypothetical protein